MTEQELTQFMNGLKKDVKQRVQMLPNHEDFIDKYCKAG
jgi:hypothetical protein